MPLFDGLADFCAKLGASAKSLLKIILLSRRSTVTEASAATDGSPIVIMGNGPSLGPLISSCSDKLRDATTMAVNFAANTDEFVMLKPDFYLMADGHFFEGRETDPNVEKLYRRLNSEVSWPMTLYTPVGKTGAKIGISNSNIKIEHFNCVGIEGFEAFERLVFRSGLGMPRPRNVLVPAIMTAMSAGFKTIYLVGADHGWLETLKVTGENVVVNMQSHFYKDNSSECDRVASVYKDIRLHEVLLSFHLAFRSYHILEKYARSRDVDIVNSTPGSYIDAFRRGDLVI